MLFLPLTSPLLRSGDDLVACLRLRENVRPGDIVVLSSKAVATVEGATVDLATMRVTEEARVWSETTKRSPAFCQAVLEETKRLNGTILRAVPGAMLTEVRPEGMTRGTILVANAGLDESNVQQGYAVGWPIDPIASLRSIKTLLSSSIPRPLPPPFGSAQGKREEGGDLKKKPLSQTIKFFAREMRSNPTEAEEVFWNAVRYDQLNVRVRRQHPIGGRILDFFIPKQKLGIELDGAYHTRTIAQRTEDALRDAYLAQDHNVQVIRFSNDEILTDLPAVLRALRTILGTSPSSIGGGGRGVEEKGVNNFALLLSDSSCTPRRRGVTAIALAACGIDPLVSTIGTNDLFGRQMTITVEAVADQLATAANALMGNAAQSIPAVIIRDHGLPFSDVCGWVPGIEPEEDLFGRL